MGNKAFSSGRRNMKEGPGVEELCSACSTQHMAALLDCIKKINGQTSFDGAVHLAIGEFAGQLLLGSG